MGSNCLQTISAREGPEVPQRNVLKFDNWLLPWIPP